MELSWECRKKYNTIKENYISKSLEGSEIWTIHSWFEKDLELIMIRPEHFNFNFDFKKMIISYLLSYNYHNFEFRKESEIKSFEVLIKNFGLKKYSKISWFIGEDQRTKVIDIINWVWFWRGTQISFNENWWEKYIHSLIRLIDNRGLKPQCKIDFWDYNNSCSDDTLYSLIKAMRKKWIHSGCNFTIYGMWNKSLKELADLFEEKWFNENIRLVLFWQNVSLDEETLIYFSNKIRKIGLSKDTRLQLDNYNLWDEWISHFFETLWVLWFSEWLQLSFNFSKCSCESAKLLAKIIEKNWMEKWVRIFLECTNIKDEWALTILEALKSVVDRWWYKEYFNIRLDWIKVSNETQEKIQKFNKEIKQKYWQDIIYV